MAIVIDETEKVFTIHTKNSTYQMKADPYGFLLHLYYGRHMAVTCGIRVIGWIRGNQCSHAGNKWQYAGFLYPFQRAGEW